jgi:hypothetical protein
LVAHEDHRNRRSVQIRVLGHLEASVDERPIALGGAKQRAVLAMLGLEANRSVTADRLAEGLWGGDPPPSAAKMIQNYVWRLRRVLAADGGGGPGRRAVRERGDPQARAIARDGRGAGDRRGPGRRPPSRDRRGDRRLVGREPLRERLHSQRMLALYPW